MTENTIKTVADVIALLGGNAALARMLGVGASTASEMKRRGRIPAEYWRDLVRGARVQGHSQVTADLLMDIHARVDGPGQVPGLKEESVVSYTPDQPAEPESGSDAADTGHFTRWKHLRRAHFASGEEVAEHIRALREEWDHR